MGAITITACGMETKMLSWMILAKTTYQIFADTF